MKTFLALLLLTTAAMAQKTPPKLYVLPHLYNGLTISDSVAADIAKRCPAAVTITSGPEFAQYRLMLSSGKSVLFDSAGNPVTTFKAHWVPTIVKDVCGYFQTLPKGTK